jgi:type I restriction enzyme, S subunit
MESDRVLTFEVESRWILADEMRLNASSFSPDAASSLVLLDGLKKKGVAIEPLGRIVNDQIFYPGRFKRIYGRQGTAFLSSKDIFDFLPVGKRIRNSTDELFVKRNWLLVTRSGSVGRVTIANELVSRSAISEHVIRIRTDASTPVGYLHAFLTSKIGKPLIMRNIFGGVVDEIEPRHLSGIPIPRIGSLERMINTRMLEAHNLRIEAQKSLLESQRLLLSELGLPSLEDDGEFLGDTTQAEARAFETKASLLDARLDASYHTPLAHAAVQSLQASGSGEIIKLAKVARCFGTPRFKRAYVKSPDDGVPLLQGTHIPQLIPQDMKYLWREMKGIDVYRVKRNWILVTCSGTIGRASLVRSQWQDWTATNHLLRIIPNEDQINPGYLTAFLLSAYGRVQFQRLIYGGVVDEIGEAGDLFNDVLIMKPSSNLQDQIGSLVCQAYDLKDRANLIEKETVSLLESSLTNPHFELDVRT